MYTEVIQLVIFHGKHALCVDPKANICSYCMRLDPKATACSYCMRLDPKANACSYCMRLDPKANACSYCMRLDLKANVCSYCMRLDLKANRLSSCCLSLHLDYLSDELLSDNRKLRGFAPKYSFCESVAQPGPPLVGNKQCSDLKLCRNLVVLGQAMTVYLLLHSRNLTCLFNCLGSLVQKVYPL